MQIEDEIDKIANFQRQCTVAVEGARRAQRSLEEAKDPTAGQSAIFNSCRALRDILAIRSGASFRVPEDILVLFDTLAHDLAIETVNMIDRIEKAQQRAIYRQKAN